LGSVSTDAGQWLRDDHPQGIRAWIDLEGAVGHADMSMVELLHPVRTGEPAFPPLASSTSSRLRR
jgi:hypothetical protein